MTKNCPDTTLELTNLTKDYGQDRGIFDVSFSVAPGEVFGFLGPNGAGKTVTMRNLMGFIRPDAGRACILGRDCFRDRATIQRNVGYLPGEISCMDDMTGKAFLTFMARMKGVRDLTRAHELITLFELDTSRKIRKMSKGTKQKVGIVCAFMNSPSVLLLDEPTSGLDPLMQNRFIDLVLEEKHRGATILLSSHLFEEVEKTCDRVGFVRQGRLINVADMDEVRRVRSRIFAVTFASPQECTHFLHLHTPAKENADTTSARVAKSESSHPAISASATSSADTATHSFPQGNAFLSIHTLDARTLEITVRGTIDAFVKDLAAYHIVDLTSREQTLEELFLHLYRAKPQHPASNNTLSQAAYSERILS